MKMKINIHTLLVIIALSLVITGMVLMDIDMAGCCLKWWQITGFDAIVLILLAIIYVQLTVRSIWKDYKKWEDGYYD